MKYNLCMNDFVVQQFESNHADDRETQKKIIKTINDGAPVLDVNRAANLAKASQDRERFAHLPLLSPSTVVS